MSGQIFVNYRRDDSSASAGRLYDRLSSHFASHQIFIDVDNLAPGVDFVEAIEGSVGSCDVLISVIGKRWLTAADEDGRRRLDSLDDFVRLEIATALKRNIRVIPVLVEGASMPRSGDLPDDLKPLVRRNALEVSHTRFNADCERLAGAIERVLEKTTAERREREEKARLEAEHRERLEDERRQEEEQEQLEAEQRQREEKEQPEAKSKQGWEGDELAVERRKREIEVPLEPNKREGRATRQRQQSQTPRASLPDTVKQNRTLHLLAKWSFIPFVLVLLSWFLPLYHFTGYQVFWEIIYHLGPDNFLDLVGFVCPVVMLCSHFLSYHWKAILEVIVSWIGFAVFVSFIRQVNVYGTLDYVIGSLGEWNTGIGIILTWCFLAAGAGMKTVVAVQRRKLAKA
jgi:hypothetical protein